jgi:acyltransferase
MNLPSAAHPPRVHALDIARAFGVLAMVFGHTCDALLSPVARAAPAVATYWKARGLTAPLFMLVSGWAVTLAVSRAPERGWDMIRARLPRVFLLLALGYALRLPGWNVRALLSGDRTTWQHLVAFDALHVIAVGLLGTLSILALPWRRLQQGLALLLLASAAVAGGLRSPSALPDTLVGLLLAQAVGGTSPFPIFPWLAYFLFGAAVPLLANDVRVRCAVGMAAVGVFLAASASWQGFGSMPPAHPILVSFRVGAVLVLLAALEAVPARVAAALAPVARSSLSVYVIHIPVVYGWFTLGGLAQRVGPRLPLGGAALAALAVLVCALAAVRLMRLASVGAAVVWRWGWALHRESPRDERSSKGSRHRAWT